MYIVKNLVYNNGDIEDFLSELNQHSKYVCDSTLFFFYSFRIDS